MRRRAAVLVLIVKRLGERDVVIVVHLGVLAVRLPLAVRRLVVVHQAERLILLAVLDEVQCLVGDDVGHVTLDRRALAVGDEDRIEVPSLSDQYRPLIEASRVGYQVPFANDAGLIARIVKQLDEGLLAAVEDGLGLVVGEAVNVAVFSGEDASAAGPAEGVGDEAIFKAHSLRRQAVEVGGLIDFTAIAGEGVGGVVVGHDVKDVRPRRRCSAVLCDCNTRHH